MNILMVTNTYTPIVGGVERSIKSFTREFERLGHNVLIVTLEFDGMPENEKGVFRVPAIRHFNGSDFSIRLPTPSNLTKILDEFKPDIVHSHHPFILGDTALRISNEYQIPLVFTHHTKYEDYTHYVPLDSPSMKKFAIELTSGYADLVDHVIAPSESIKELLNTRGVKTPVDVVPTGVDFQSFSKGNGNNFRKEFNIKEDEFILGHVGRLAPEKNLTFLIKSIIPFLKQNQNSRFLLIGKGPSLNEIKKTFQTEGIEDRLIYPGVLESQELIDAYHAMDVFVFSSKTETQGMVLLEAMAAGVPVVALDASGVKDVLRDKENGILVRNEDVKEFSQSSEMIYKQNDKQRQLFKAKAIETANTLSIKKTASKLIKIYKTLLKNDFIYSDIESSPWVSVLGRIKAEWELLTNLTEAVGSVINDKFSRKQKENKWQKVKRWLNNNEWSARIAGLSQSEGTAINPGLVLIQIDGLGLNQIKKAMKNGKMPFLQKLIKKEGYNLSTFYSGQPSSTPAVQAELFYGVKGAVPSFSFLDQETGEIFKMYDQNAAIEIEKRLKKDNTGLLEGGSSYSNIYSGGAKETHFCAVDLGWDKIWQKIKPIKIIILGCIHILSIIKTTFKLVIELFSSFLDFIDGLLKGEDLIKELKFIPTRLAICILLRDLITFGAKIDVIRGLPITHVNFTGYDEHAHRRGASSKFAHWTLWGIDRCISKLYKETLRSQRRNYDVWIYSDHGQEHMLSYAEEHKMFVHHIIKKIFQDIFPYDNGLEQVEERGVQSHRANYLGTRIFNKISPFHNQEKSLYLKEKVVVTAMGPVGHVYLPRVLTDKEKDLFARRLVEEGKIPLVLSSEASGKISAWNKNGKFCLPDNSKEVFGKAHPFLKEVTDDIIKTCSHHNVGAFTISGWDPDGPLWSFPKESGAHGGPGIEETTGFSLLPSDIISSKKNKPYIRPIELRKAALKFMKRETDDQKTQETFIIPNKDKPLRIMTYNVHGCEGMDYKISPARIARVIARYQPDIVALQELDMNRARSSSIDQPNIIAKELEMYYHFHPSIQVEEQKYGNAILSKYPMELICAKSLPGIKGNNKIETRGAMWVSIDLGNNERVQVINTHLGLKHKERINQIDDLLGNNWMAHPDCHSPKILIGDFNAFPGSTVCKKIKNNFRDVQEELLNHRPKATWGGHFAVSRIDHIFVEKGIEVKNVKVASAHVDRIASDHFPLIADLEIE